MSSPAPDWTWPSLLTHWTAFAQSSLALPKNAEGDRWRAAVPAIIGLQAVAFALADLDKLSDEAERPVGIDKAEMLIRKHTADLHALWRGEPMHEELVRLTEDARAALVAARGAGVEWCVTAERLVAAHPAELVAALVNSGFRGDLFLPVPGTVLFQGSPAAFARSPGGGPPPEHVKRAVKEFLVDLTKPQRVPRMRQVYRQFDFGKGRVVRDLVLPMDATLPPGQTQLVPVIEGGRPVPVTLPIPGMANLDPVPVEFGG